MFALQHKKEGGHGDCIWSCDWGRIQPQEEEEGEAQDIVVTGGVDDVVKVWDYKDGSLSLRHTLTSHSLGVVSVCLSPDSRRLASSSLDSAIILWDTARGEKVGSIDSGGPTDTWTVAFSPDSKHVASGSNSGVITLYSADTGAKEGTLDTKGKFTLSLAYSPNGKWLASGAVDGIIVLFEMSEGARKLVQTLEGHAMPIRSLSFSPDSQRLVTGSDDGHIKVYDCLATFSLLCTLSGHTSWVLCVSWSHDSQHFASGSSDSTVKVWELSTKQCVHTFAEHSDQVWAVKYNKEGNKLLSVSDDKNINIYNIPA